MKVRAENWVSCSPNPVYMWAGARSYLFFDAVPKNWTSFCVLFVASLVPGFPGWLCAPRFFPQVWVWHTELQVCHFEHYLGLCESYLGCDWTQGCMLTQCTTERQCHTNLVLHVMFLAKCPSVYDVTIKSGLLPFSASFFFHVVLTTVEMSLPRGYSCDLHSQAWVWNTVETGDGPAP